MGYLAKASDPPVQAGGSAMCAGHERQLGGESPLPILTEEKG
jgi:hypothetical protein